MRKTTVLINEHLLEEAKKAVGVKSIREVIETALHTLVRQSNRDALRKELGTYDIDLTIEDLEALRNAS
ncbi:MAG: type II toxin-antitoxin system VapB family antitoxin [Thermodesulfobacteriota bacterium]